MILIDTMVTGRQAESPQIMKVFDMLEKVEIEFTWDSLEDELWGFGLDHVVDCFNVWLKNSF